MKIIKFTLLAFIAIITIAACKKKTSIKEEPVKPAPTSANVTMQFNNQVDGQAIEFGQMKYTNSAGNMYQIDMLKYYITRVILVKSDNTEFALNNYDLINAADLSTCMFNASNVPNGTYTKIKFNVGIPKDRNHTGAQDGDLDPVMGMIWDWNTGYVFFKHEGKFKNTSSATQSLTFHYATDRALASVEVPLTTNLTVNGIDKKVILKFNLNKLYAAPNVDFNSDNNRQSSSSSDFIWIDNMRESFPDAFLLDKIE